MDVLQSAYKDRIEKARISYQQLNYIVKSFQHYIQPKWNIVVKHIIYRKSAANQDYSNRPMNKF